MIAGAHAKQLAERDLRLARVIERERFRQIRRGEDLLVQAVRDLLGAAPLGALLVVVGGGALGSFAGGYVAARISKKSALLAATVLAIVTSERRRR